MIKALLLLFFLVFPGTDETLLESGKGTTLRKQTAPASEVKVVSYNIRWRSGDDLKEIIKLLHEDPEIGGAAILGLQEVDRAKKRSGKNNTVKMIADELGLHYAWAAPPAPKPTDEEETGVAILSVYPLSDVRRMVLPHEGPNRRRRVALGATVEIENRNMQERARPLLSERGTLAVDQRTNVLIARDLSGNLNQIEELIRSLVQNEEQQRRHASVRWGVVLVCLAVGFALIEYFGWDDVTPGAIAVLLAATGVGNLVLFYVSRNLPN